MRPGLSFAPPGGAIAGRVEERTPPEELCQMDPADWRTVRAAPLFAPLSADVVQAVVGNRGSRSYEKGAIVFHQGEVAAAFFLVLDGWIKIYRTTPDGLEVVLHVLRRGETFAESAIFGGGRYPTSAETVSAARLLRIDGDVFRAQICERPELALSMLASASKHLDHLTEQIEQIKVRSAPQRLSHPADHGSRRSGGA
jgi:CRP-like cAMP-binding protein